ncbi:MAG: CRTAC1 family protein, partial [Catalinimonas sp.]
MRTPLSFCLLLVLSAGWNGCRQSTPPSEAAAPAAPAAPAFTYVDPATSGVTFINTLRENARNNIFTYENYYHGGGVAVGDLNGDTLPDLYFTSNLAPNGLFLNQGDFRFEDVTAATNMPGRRGWTTGVTMADVNADGRLDIYVCYSGKRPGAMRRNQLFVNQGNDAEGRPRFREMAAAYGVADSSHSTHATFFDYDLDGDLDLFVLNQSVETRQQVIIKETFRTERVPDASDNLFRNDGPGPDGHPTFTNVSEEAGLLGNVLSYGLGVAVTDFNQDGWPDIYVTNDFHEHDYLYINQHEGGRHTGFRESVKEYFRHTSKFAMGVDVGDINNDLQPDLVALDMLPEDNHRQKLLLGPEEYEAYELSLRYGYHPQFMRNTLQVSNGPGPSGHPAYSEISQVAGISNTDWSWSPLLADFDNDGLQDLYVTNGFRRDLTNMDFFKFTYPESYLEAQRRGGAVDYVRLLDSLDVTPINNYLYHNQGNLAFKKVVDDWGLDRPSFSNGAAYADLDLDGDLDLVVNNIDAPAFLIRNDRAAADRRSLRVRLRGQGGNTYGIGARVEVSTDVATQVRELYPSRGFLSAVEPVLHFGLGAAAGASTVRVTWPDGRVETRRDVAPGVITLDQADARETEAADPTRRETPLLLPFADARGLQ